MFIEIKNILSPSEIARLREIGASARFVDGKISNPHNQTKNNLQIDPQDPARAESVQIVGQALMRNEEVRNFAFIRRMAPPLLCKYTSEMAYGRHPDSAYLPMQPTPLRSDISCTVFLAPPETYDGGALTIHLGSRPISIKGDAGSAVLYPSTTIHEVEPVRSGERFVAITFMESQICDEKKRELLYILNDVAALEGYNIGWDNRVRLEHVRQSLHRMWSTS
ncbi:MAG: Fe2+-dependent dioxygenase [Alphaproteobacteria bacterium]|nr:Fe2+-dependent dioxygenase [Alphaproteobacteria bacterium]